MSDNPNQAEINRILFQNQLNALNEAGDAAGAAQLIYDFELRRDIDALAVLNATDDEKAELQQSHGDRLQAKLLAVGLSEDDITTRMSARLNLVAVKTPDVREVKA